MKTEAKLGSALDTLTQIREQRNELRRVLKIALNEIHHPGACAYEHGENITDLIERTLAKPTPGR